MSEPGPPRPALLELVLGAGVAVPVVLFFWRRRCRLGRARARTGTGGSRGGDPVGAGGRSMGSDRSMGSGRSTGSDSQAGAVSGTGRGQRGMELARLGSRVGASMVGDSARGIFASAEGRRQRRTDRQLRTTTEVVETLGSMKGVFMKLGQMASYLEPSLDPQVRATLGQLQAHAAPMAPELAAAVIRAELGQAPERFFAEWDPVPLAAASIGQVHRAITTDGRAVAVKVQYPGVDDAIRSDLDNSATLLSVVRLAFPSLDAPAVVQELRSRIGEELDYEQEATNQSLFARHFAGHPFIHVPAVIPECSTRRVLTSELVVGSRYDEVLEWSQEERDLAGETIFRFVFGGLYRLQVFNGDPHPGNYLFHGQGRVTFLDFGLVKWFEPEEVDLLAAMVQAAVTSPDDHAFRLAVERAGFLRHDPSLSDREIAEYFRHYYALVIDDAPSDFSEDYATDTLRHFFDAGSPVVKRANVPAPFVVLQRINLGLYAVLAGLHATGNWRRIAEEIWPWVASAPSTELGRSEAMWRAGGAGEPPMRRPEVRKR